MLISDTAWCVAWDVTFIVTVTKVLLLLGGMLSQSSIGIAVPMICSWRPARHELSIAIIDNMMLLHTGWTCMTCTPSSAPAHHDDPSPALQTVIDTAALTGCSWHSAQQGYWCRDS
jgi:hypothetical protein